MTVVRAAVLLWKDDLRTRRRISENEKRKNERVSQEEKEVKGTRGD